MSFEDLSGLFDRNIAATKRTSPSPQKPNKEWCGPRFQGRELPIGIQKDAVARRDARIRALNQPQQAHGLLARVAEAVAGMAGTAVDAVAPGKRAEAFLRDVLACGQVPSLEIERLAKKAGIAVRTLRRAAKRLGVKHTRNADLSWNWKLPA
jgi:hypothetical protein